MAAVTKNRNFFNCPLLLERDPPRDHPCQVWFNLVQRFQRRRFKCDLLSKYVTLIITMPELSNGMGDNPFS
jgi:hypothetical protein